MVLRIDTPRAHLSRAAVQNLLVAETALGRIRLDGAGSRRVAWPRMLYER